MPLTRQAVEAASAGTTCPRAAVTSRPMPKSRSRQRSHRRPYAAPPPRKKPKASPTWYGFLVLGLMVVGVAMIVLNYMGLMPGDTQRSGCGWGSGSSAASSRHAWRREHERITPM